MLNRTRLSAPRSALRMAVDPISNAIAISAANPAYPPKRTGATLVAPDRWGAALSEGVLADDLLWPIIHELTHHSSLNTAVGASMAALAVSHTSVAGAQFDEERFGWVAKDAVRHALMERLLRPLFEGLALFAEFDAVSGKVPVASWSQQTTAMLFCKDEMRSALLKGDDVLAPLKDKLETERRALAAVSRKKALLSRSIADNDCYLLGYLLVKTLWNDLIARALIWKHSDIFQAFLSDYFFNDFRLAQLLVPVPGAEADDEPEMLTQYLQHRTLSLCANGTQLVQEFLPWMHDRRSPRPGYQAFSDSGVAQLGFWVSLRTLRSLHYATPDFVRTRHIPRVLVAPATVRVNGEGAFEATFADGNPPFSGPALDAGRPIDGGEIVGDGSVEAVLLLPEEDRSAFRLLLCVFIDKDLIATFDLEAGQFNDQDAAQACDKMASYLAVESFCVVVESERLFREDSETQHRIDALRGADGQRRALELWTPFALIPELEEADRPESTSLLREGGLKGALRLADSQMRLLSRVSLSPLDTQPGHVLDEQELHDILELNARSLQVLGFRLFNLEGHTLLPSRV